MVLQSKRNLIFLSVLYFAILGCFLLGCSEGTDSSPVSAIRSNINEESANLAKSGIQLMGELVLMKEFKETLKKQEKTSLINYYERNLLNIPITLYKFNEQTKNYTYISNTVSDGTAYFEFGKLLDGIYKIEISGNDVFQKKESFVTINEDKIFFGNASDAVEIRDTNEIKQSSPFNMLKVEMSVSLSKMNNLTINIVSAHNGKPIQNAEVRIDGELMEPSNENGKIVVNGLDTGFHKIQIDSDPTVYSTLTGKFEVIGSTTLTPFTIGNSRLDFCVIEKDSSCSISGQYYPKNELDSTPKFVRLYKFAKEPGSYSNISKFTIDSHFVRKTKTSYGIDRLPNGSFKFTNLEPGYYQILVSNSDKSLEPLENKYIEANSSENEKDRGCCFWQKLDSPADSDIISKPLKVSNSYTTHWSNDDELIYF